MKSFWKRGLIGVLALAVAVGLASELWPERAAKLLLAANNLSAGLERNFIEISVGRVHYLERGTGEAVVFLHGIFALKEHWIDMSREVSSDYLVILLDLPGFGENQRLAAAEYDYDRQAQNVIEALDAIGLDDFHIVANSMGAQIAGLLAVSSPERIKSIAFIGGPVGVKSPVASDMEVAISNGSLPLVVTSEAEYDDRMAWLFPEEPFIPRPIARFWAANEVSNAEINLGTWEAVAESSAPRLEELAPDIVQPALILWCEDDRIFHVSGAAVLEEALPNALAVIRSGCGHLPMLDQPVETGRQFQAFLRDQE